MNRERRLLVDAMLGRLVTYLRMCGYDTVYTLEADIESDDTIRSLARTEDRTLLTRDRELAAGAADGLLLTARERDDQLAELAAAGFDLSLPDEPRRCSRCNGPLTGVEPGATTPEYAPDPGETEVWRCRHCGQQFWRCRHCGQQFWRGSHWEAVATRLAGH